MSTLTIPQRELALQLAQAGSEHPKALAKVAQQFDISTVDAIDLALMHCHPQKVAELLTKGLKVEEVCVIYDVVEHYSSITKTGTTMRPSIRKLSDFATWFLGTDFSEEELLDALETAFRIYPSYWKRSLDYGAEISYALGYGRAIRNHSIASIETMETERFDANRAIVTGVAHEAPDYSDHGQGDI